jgi:hypothetical protein
VQTELKKCSNLLLLKIRNYYKEGENRSIYNSNIVKCFNEFVREKLQPIASDRMTDVIIKIIGSSLQAKNYSIFVKSSSLLQFLTHLPTHLLRLIKSCTPIESDHSHELLRRINKLYNALSIHIVDYIYYYDTTV